MQATQPPMDPSLTQQTTTSTGGCGGRGPKDITNIVKGKRTKRQRLQSSIPFTIVAHSSTSYNTFDSSPAPSSDIPAGSTATEDDEDTAKCLILLSKGHNITEELYSSYKFNSKKYIQTSTDDHRDGVAGIYVYECKTCSRTFPSFQALGGHRASHNKPRINEFEKRKQPPYVVFSDEDEPSPPWRKDNSSSSSSLSLQLNHRVSSPGNTKILSSKLHECSICGTGFNSGQALGGHMRRHRVANGSGTTTAVTVTNTTLSLIPYSPVITMVADDQDIQKSRNDGLFLDLNLNLPAPPETAVVASHQDHHLESSFKFTANQSRQQQAVHLSSTPTLVDCHY